MNKSIAKILKSIAAVIGLSEIVAKEDGSLDITAEQREKIEGIYGKEVLDRIEQAIANREDASDVFRSMIEAAQEKDRRIESLEGENARLMEEKTALQGAVRDLSEEPEPAPAHQGASGGQMPAFRLNAKAAHNRIAAMAVSGNAGAAFAAAENETIDTSDLKTEFGTVMPPQTKLEVLSKRIYNGFKDAKYFRRIQSNTNYKAAALDLSEVSQQFTPAWTPKGKANVTPIEIVYRRHKINVKLVAADILSSWLQYLYEQGKKPADMPFIKYIIENHVLPKVTDDITLSMIAKGKFVDHNDGTAKDGDAGSAAKDSMDGIETILVEEFKSGKSKMNFYKKAVDYTTLSAQELLDYVDGFVDSISPLFSSAFNVHCSPEFLTAYLRADFSINGKYTGNIDKDGSIRFTKFRLAPLESMYKSKILFATSEGNMAMLVDYAKAASCINDIQSENYAIKVFGEYSLSVGFRIAEAVYAAIPIDYEPAVADSAKSFSDDWVNGSAELLSAPGVKIPVPEQEGE